MSRLEGVAAPATTTLRARLLKGGGGLAVGTIVERLARLGRNMLLARVIAPDQFGLMAIVLAILALFEAITEVGVSQAVIQNKNGDKPGFLNLAWWMGVGRGLIVAAIAIPLAPVFAHFYDQPELASLLMVAPVTVVFIGLTSPRIYAQQRQFRFGATLWTIQGAGLLGTAATIALGFALQSVWALVFGAIFEAFARFVLSFVFCPIRPSLTFDRQAWKDLFGFTRGMAGLSLLTLVLLQADTFVLGAVATMSDVGLYTMAIALAAFPLAIFSKVVQPLVVPILALVQDDMVGLRANVLRLSRLVWLFGLPLATVLAVVSAPLLILVYGRPEFSQVATAFALYAVFVVVYMASMVTFSVYLAIGRPGLQRLFTAVRATLVLVSIYPLAVTLGGTGTALALLVSMIGAMVVQLFNLRRVIGLGIGSYLKTLRAGLLSAAGFGVPLLIVVVVFDLPHWATVGIGVAVGAAAWGLSIIREGRELRRLRLAANTRSTMDHATPAGPPDGQAMGGAA